MKINSIRFILLWTSVVFLHYASALTIETPKEYQGISYNAPRFLLSLREFSVTGPLVVVENGCEPLTSDVEGFIVLVPYNASCLLYQQILNVQNANVIVSNIIFT